MNLKRPKYILLVAVFTVTGLFTSMVHYHSEGLECLEHNKEDHIVQTEDFCPISTLVTDDDFVTAFTFEALLPSKDLELTLRSNNTIDFYIPSKAGRSPPSLI